MTHTYPISIYPPEFGRCSKPAALVVQCNANHVLAFCEDSHLIKGRIYPDQWKAEAVAARLQKWIELSKVK